MSTGDQSHCRVLFACVLGCAVVLAACSSPNTTKQGPGSSCNGDNSLCSSGMCLSVDSGTSICSQVCTRTSDCPQNFVCGSTPRTSNVCLPIGLNGNCKTDKECSAGFVCDTDAGRCYIKVDRGLCDPCTSDKQCKGPGGEQGVCRQDGNSHTCTVPCDSGSCPDGYVCSDVAGSSVKQCLRDNQNHTCGPEKGLCESCHSDAECGLNSTCVRNLASNEQFCATSCQLGSTTDCPNGFACGDLSGVGAGPNVCLPTSRTCSGYCNSAEPEQVRRQCGIAAGCDVTARACQPKTDGSQCAACMTDDNCVGFNADYVCLENQCTDCPFKGEKFCAAPCTPPGGASPCATGYTCTRIGIDANAPSYCIPDSGSCTAGAGIVGDDCTALGASTCLSGICVGLGASSVCSTTCMLSADCGRSDYQCCALSADGSTYDCSQAPSGQEGVCAPVGGPFGADCSLGRPPCASSLLCLNLGTAALCTNGCSSDADCPTEFACREGQRPNGDGTFEQLKVCFPSGGGILGANCTFGPAACQSGLCMKKPTGNICTQACGKDLPACPSGYKCAEQPLSTGTDKAMVCTPVVL